MRKYMERNSSTSRQRCEKSYSPWCISPAMENTRHDDRASASKNVVDVSAWLRDATTESRATDAIPHETRGNRIINKDKKTYLLTVIDQYCNNLVLAQTPVI